MPGSHEQASLLGLTLPTAVPQRDKPFLKTDGCEARNRQQVGIFGFLLALGNTVRLAAESLLGQTRSLWGPHSVGWLSLNTKLFQDQCKAERQPVLCRVADVTLSPAALLYEQPD